MPFVEKETLCWRCTRPGSNTCSWDASKGRVPVDGWEAERVLYPAHDGIITNSFIVKKCPLFDETENYDERCVDDDFDDCGRKPISKEVIKRIYFRLDCGWSQKNIADELNISTSTVKRHKREWLAKKRGMRVE